MTILYPDPFLEVRVDFIDLPVPGAGLCAGYEGGLWRGTQLADHLFNWLPYVGLNQEHQFEFGSATFVELLKIACAHIYNTRKTDTRGELGELLLHLCCILHYGTVPVLCKLILKTSSNDTVKGFDGIHIVVTGDTFELWLGESKFYIDGRSAIREAVKSIEEHIAPAFLSTEKAMVLGHIGPGVPRRADVLRLFKQQTSGDTLIEMSVFPVLVAYESKSVRSHQQLCDEYTEALRSEVAALRTYFCTAAKDLPLRFRLIFVPLGSKQDVIDRFDKKLEAFL